MSRRALRIAAVIILAGVLGFWYAKGANPGWTKTSITHKQVDDVTGIEGITYQKGFLPGLDFLAAGVIISTFIAGASFLAPKRATKPSEPG